jgi:hypothetical protein
MAIATALVALFALPALAQNPSQGTPTRARGVVDKLDGQTLTVKSREGAVLTIALAPDVAIQTLVKKSLADIKPGDFVASTGIKDRPATSSRWLSRSAGSPYTRAAPLRSSSSVP